MRFRNTLLLAALCLALGGYIVFVEFDRAAREEEKQTLLTFEQGDVTAIKLIYPDREIVLERTDGEWKITAPLETKADKATVQSLIRSVADCEVTRTFENVTEDLSLYGLTEPSASIELTLGTEKLPAIRVGKTTPIGHSTYVQRADKPEVFLTGSAFHAGMDKKLTDLRDKKILVFDDKQVGHVAVHGPERDLLLRKENDAWRLERPVAQAADAATVRMFLSTLGNLQAVEFPDDAPADLAQYGLDQPRLRIAVGDGEDRRELLLGTEKDDKNIYVKTADRPTVYEVGNWVYRDLDKGPNDFRDKTLLAFTAEEVSTIEVTVGDGEVLVLRRGDKGGWSIEGEAAVLDGSAGDDFLTDLAALKGYEVAADQPDDLGVYGLASPAIRVSVRGTDDAPVGTVLLGSYEAEGEKRYAAMREGQPTVFLVREFNFGSVNKKKSDFLPQPTPTAAPPESSGT